MGINSSEQGRQGQRPTQGDLGGRGGGGGAGGREAGVALPGTGGTWTCHHRATERSGGLEVRASESPVRKP